MIRRGLWGARRNRGGDAGSAGRGVDAQRVQSRRVGEHPPGRAASGPNAFRTRPVKPVMPTVPAGPRGLRAFRRRACLVVLSCRIHARIAEQTVPAVFWGARPANDDPHVPAPGAGSLRNAPVARSKRTQASSMEGRNSV